MKKVKFMILSLALVAVVGGALAFKAKQPNRFCTTVAVDFQDGFGITCIDHKGPGSQDDITLTCPNLILAATTNTNQGDFYCTTPEPEAGLGCDSEPNCQTPTKQLKDGDF